MQIYRNETGKPLADFVIDLTNAARAKGFLVNNRDTMDMARTFAHHGAEVADGFDLHMIQVCKPEKAAGSLSKNPERAVLMPKFIMTFSAADRTQVRFLHYRPETVRALVDDDQFPQSLNDSFAQLIGVIEEAL